MSEQTAFVIDIAAILDLLFIHQPELTKDPHRFVIWPRWWISCSKGKCEGNTLKRETLPTLWTLSSGSIKAALQICPHIILLDLSRQKRFCLELQMRTWHKKVKLDWIHRQRKTLNGLTGDVDTTCSLPLLIYDQCTTNSSHFLLHQPPTKQQR